jgi:catechol 1,2-dioxygenase
MSLAVNRREVLGTLGALVFGPGLFQRFAWADEDATETNIEGPFYKPDAPWRSKLLEKDEKTLTISGTVFGPGKKPLANAVVDVWHADAKGDYDNDGFKHRGRLKTDKDGRYEIETVMPGRYPLDESHWRPAHVHYKVSAEGHVKLTTQLYFKGDPHLEKDPFVKKSLVMEVKDSKVTFEIRLKKASSDAR